MDALKLDNQLVDVLATGSGLIDFAFFLLLLLSQLPHQLIVPTDGHPARLNLLLEIDAAPNAMLLTMPTQLNVLAWDVSVSHVEDFRPLTARLPHIEGLLLLLWLGRRGCGCKWSSGRRRATSGSIDGELFSLSSG